MKLQFEAVVATAGKDIDGEAFSIADLELMREQAIGKSISVNFLHVLEGNVDKAVLTDDNELLLKGWLELNRSPLGIHWEIYMVPGYLTNGEDNVVEQLVEFGLTYNPADVGIKAVQFYESVSD